MLRFLSTGESHGQALIAVLDGFPAGMNVDIELLNKELQARQQGYGRGNRQKIETDKAELIGGVRHGITTGAPISFLVRNRDFENWQHVMSSLPVDEHDEAVIEQEGKKKISRFRPGHADLAGTMKFRQKDIRDVLERASARETAARVAAGALCQQLLSGIGVRMVSHVIAVGPVASQLDSETLSMDELEKRVQNSEMFCASDDAAVEAMKEYIKQAWQDGDSVGGVVEVLAESLPVGLGSYTQWDEKLDGQLAQAVMSIQAMKAVEIGDGVKSSARPGSEVHDALYPRAEADAAGGAEIGERFNLPFTRQTNHAGGIEGGMSNGSRLRLRAYMKPIPTLRKGLPSLSFPEYEAETAHYERSDVCAVPAASIVAKAMVAFVLARAVLRKFGSDNFSEIKEGVSRHRKWCEAQGVAGRSMTKQDEDVPEMEME
jgi:chorismate synthase